MGTNGYYRGPIQQYEKDMRKLLNNKESSDIEFTIGKDKKRLYAHKMILSARCELFRAMFSRNNQKDKDKNVDGPIVLIDVDYDTFLLMMEYIYCNTISANTSQFDRVVCLTRYAVEYGLEELKKLSLDFLSDHMNILNCCRITNIAVKHSQTQLQEKCYKFIEKNFEKVTQEKDFLSLPDSAMIVLLESDKIDMKETDIIKVIYRWATQRAFETSQTISEVMKSVSSYIRLGTLTIDELTQLEEENRSYGNMIPAELFAQAWKYHATGKRNEGSLFSRMRKCTH